MEVQCLGINSCIKADVIGAKQVICKDGACLYSTATDVKEIVCDSSGSCYYLKANSCGLSEPATIECNKESHGGSNCVKASVTGLTCSGSNCHYLETEQQCPTESPTGTPTASPVGAGGDPHIQRWDGGYYDYHAMCDLMMLNASQFSDGLGLRLHARTTKRYQYSYIESAAVQIGKDVFEVGSWGEYFLNGILGADLSALASNMFNITHAQLDNHNHVFEVALRATEKLIIKTHKDIVSFSLHNASGTDFQDSVGMMGAFGTRAMLARDGLTEVQDQNDFGNGWQILDTEPSLFQNADRYPQYPQACVAPEAKTKSRHLGESIARQAAEEACAHWTINKDACISDVIATGALELAESGSFY